MSTICSSTLVRAGVRSSSPSRSRESMFSPTWVTSSSRLKARKPLVPLIVWIVRKMLDSRSREFGLLLQRDQVGVQLVEVLVALDQELLDDVVQTVHRCCLLSHVATGLRSPPGWVIGGPPAESR